MKKIRMIGTAIVVALWLAIALWAWLTPTKAQSAAERRPLAQMPELSAETLEDGSFVSNFESYTLDQFPLRDSFRQVKSLFHYYVLGQSDNNGIYLVEDTVAKLE